jgi:hypothetical protein
MVVQHTRPACILLRQPLGRDIRHNTRGTRMLRSFADQHVVREHMRGTKPGTRNLNYFSPRVRAIYAFAAFLISPATSDSGFTCFGVNHGK